MRTQPVNESIRDWGSPVYWTRLCSEAHTDFVYEVIKVKYFQNPCRAWRKLVLVHWFTGVRNFPLIQAFDVSEIESAE